MDRLELAAMRAEEAERIVKSEIFTAAFDDTRQALLNALASMDNLRDDRARDVHAMVKGLDKVKRCLEVHIESGTLARKEIEGRARLSDLNPFKRRA